jgi:hypothetical protein
VILASRNRNRSARHKKLRVTLLTGPQMPLCRSKLPTRLRDDPKFYVPSDQPYCPQRNIVRCSFPTEGPSQVGVRGVLGISVEQYLLWAVVVCKGNAQTRQTRSVSRSAMPTDFFRVPGVLAGARSWPPPIGANFPVCPGQPIFYVPRCRLGQFEVPAVRSGRAQGKRVLGDWSFRAAGSSGFLASALVSPARVSRFSDSRPFRSLPDG